MATGLLIITFNAILLTFNVCYRLPIVYYYITGTLFIFKCGKCGTTPFAFNRTHPALFTDCRNISHFWLHFAFFAYFRKFPLHEFCQCFQPTFLTSFTLLNFRSLCPIFVHFVQFSFTLSNLGSCDTTAPILLISYATYYLPCIELLLTFVWIDFFRNVPVQLMCCHRC